MNVEQRMHGKRATDKFIDSVAFLAGDESIADSFPEPVGLGTDGGCWTDAELLDYMIGVAKRSTAILRRMRKFAATERTR